MADFKEDDQLETVVKELDQTEETITDPDAERAEELIEEDIEENLGREVSEFLDENQEEDSGFLDEDYDEDGTKLDSEQEPESEAEQDLEPEQEPAPVIEGRGRSRRRSRKKEGTPAVPNQVSEKSEKKAGGDSAGSMAEEPKKTGGKKTAAVIAGALAAVILVAGGVYLALGQKYKKVFFPNTQINGVDASGRTVEEVQKLISSSIDGYVLTIEERDGKTEEIKKDDISLHSEFDGSLDEILAAQEPVKWLKYQISPSDYQIKTMIAYDEEAFDSKVESLTCMTDSLMVQPVDASLSQYVSGQGYSIVPEVMGTALKKEEAKKGIADAVMKLEKTISLEDAGCYEAPAVKSGDAALTGLRDTMNKYAGVTVTYQFGSEKEVLNGDRTNEWLVVNGDYSVGVDAAKAAAFVEELAISRDTYNKAKTIKTSYGPTIKVTGGNYGWKINRSGETEALIEVLKAGQSVEREPVYSQKGASRGENDYGSTYVEINLTAQHLFYYKNGSLITESDFVSGNLSKGWGTPAGTYPLTYKERNATLKGENYRTPVDYWMPFNGGIGMHDATWRSTFGGAIYKTGGSHGCVNLPHSVAQKIYENISSGTPVICYNLAGTEGTGSSAQKPAETAAAAETSAATETMAPAETTAPAVTLFPEAATTPAPTPAPETQPVPETTAPAGPGSDTGGNSGSGPGSVQ